VKFYSPKPVVIIEETPKRDPKVLAIVLFPVPLVPPIKIIRLFLPLNITKSSKNNQFKKMLGVKMYKSQYPFAHPKPCAQALYNLFNILMFIIAAVFLVFFFAFIQSDSVSFMSVAVFGVVGLLLLVLSVFGCCGSRFIYLCFVFLVSSQIWTIWKRLFVMCISHLLYYPPYNRCILVYSSYIYIV
jgi:hypothetical protein